MKISSKIMALTMTAMLAAAPVFAADYSSGNMSGSASVNSGIQSTPSTKVTSDTKVKAGTNRVQTRGRMGLKGNMQLSLSALDKNGNGVITKSEFRKARLSRGLFNKIDKNRDGIITKAELDAYNGKISGVDRVKTR